MRLDTRLSWTRLAAALVLAAAGCTPQSPPEPQPVLVRISYGSEKKTLIEDSLRAFAATSPRTPSGRPIRVEAVAEGSAEAMESILAGRTDITVWSPASSLLVDVLNERWLERPGALGQRRKLVDSAPSLVLSPVVVAMWEPMARALGWPRKALGWADMAEIAGASQGWSRYGHPEWGAFKFGHTHPRYSNSGLLALVAATYAGAGKTRELQDADVERAAPFVRRVQSSVVHYGRSTGFFADSMFRRGPEYLSAAVLYENLVVESALDPKYHDKAFPVVAIYPREGTFWADHPYAILDLPSVDPESRAAAEKYRDFMLSAERQRTAMERFGFRPADASIAISAPIDAAHGVDPQQPRNVLPNPPVVVTRHILDSFEMVKRPVSITFVIDTSGSMKGEPMEQAKQGARTFLEAVPDGDVVRVMTFAHEPHWLAAAPEALARARPRLVQGIEGSFADGGTALYDAIAKATPPSSADPRGAARAIVVLTDGEDTDSAIGLDALLALLRLQSAEAGSAAPRVFTIAYGPRADTAVLQRIAEAGGGAFFSGTPKDIKSVYAELATFF